jgi:uncharacterized protein YbjT (DUF2867 family)
VLKILLIIFVVYALALAFAMVRKAPGRKSAKPASRGWGNRMRILVIGATGGTGQQLLRKALDLGHEVTVLVRKPQRLKIEHPRLRVAKGNVLDYASVESAMQGQNAVVCALGTKRFFFPTRTLSEGTRNILRAMKSCNVPRLICESSLGLGSSVGRLGLLFTFFVVPVILPFIFWDKIRQEKLIEESDTDWLIVRPGVLKNAEARGTYRHGPNLGNFLWSVRISRADVADFMLKQLTNDSLLGTAQAVSW